MANKTVAVLGLGLFGSAVARTLAKKGVDVIAIDRNMEHVDEVADVVEQAIQADFTKIESLQAAGVDLCDLAIVATGEKLEITILAIMNLKKLGIENVIVKTKNVEYKEVLLKVGASRVVLPEYEMGKRLANECASTDVLDLIRLDDNYHVIEIHALKEWLGKRINELNVRENYGINIIAIKSQETGEFSINVDPLYVVNAEDILVVLSENQELNRKFSMGFDGDN